MIGLKFKDGQGLGNQLWNYIACRCIAKKNNYNFTIFNRDLFKGKSFLRIDYGVNTEIKDFTLIKENLYYDQSLEYISSIYDSKFEKLQKKSLIEGLFQDERYFFSYKNFIKKFLVLITKNKSNFDKDTCVLNIRGGEYKRHKKLILPKSYWDNSIDTMKSKFNIKNFIIVTDDYYYAKDLFPKFEIITNNIEKCFSALVEAQYLIISNSSFSYFPIKLGQSKFIIAPKYWSRFENKLSRWASPCNLYEGYHFIDQNGKLFSYQDCLKEKEDLEDLYIKNNNLKFDDSYLDLSGIRKYFPKKFREILKKFFSRIFPRKIG